MISFLTGTVHTKLTDSVILLAGEVGYLVNLPIRALSQLNQNQKLELYIYTQVKEDAIELYGFKTIDELAFFKLIIGVSGIGPKTALLVIDRGVEEVKTAIVKADTDFFVTIPRLGQKNAQRIIIDLKNKLGSLVDLNLQAQSGEMMEVIQALQSMGYSKQESLQAIKLLPSDASLEQKLTLALRNLGKNERSSSSNKKI